MSEEAEIGECEGVPSKDNLNVCEEHRVMMHSEEGSDKKCPLCMSDIEVPVGGKEVTGIDVNTTEIRRRITAETMAELIPLMREYITDVKGEDVGVWVTVQECEESLPAGYAEAQERWINVLTYEWSPLVKSITKEEDAQSTIESLREEGYGDGVEP